MVEYNRHGLVLTIPLDEEDVHMPGPSIEEVQPLQSDYIQIVGGPMLAPSTKKTNPKDAVGVRKAPITTIPLTVISELGIAMLEGARKYGRHNYRVDGVRASVYIDAVFRHISKWWEGEDLDPDSELNHITKAIASLVVLRDAQICGNCTDDRPPKSPKKHFEDMDVKASKIIDKYKEAKDPFMETDNVKGRS